MSSKKNLILILTSIFSTVLLGYSIITYEVMGFLKAIMIAIEGLSNFLAFVFLGSKFGPFGDLQLRVPVFNISILVFWLFVSGVYISIKCRFIGIKSMKVALCTLFSKKERDIDNKQIGLISQTQAFFVATAATVGLGNIAGVSVAVTVGGPGALFWMMVAAFLGMTLKFAEVTLGHKYRVVEKDQAGNVVAIKGGPQYYLKIAVENLGFKKTGKILSKVYAIGCIFGALGAGMMFQLNQAVSVLQANVLPSVPKEQSGILLSFIATLVVLFIIVGGVVKVAKITEVLVPFMSVSYIIMCLIIIFLNLDKILPAIILVLNQAFNSMALFGGGLGIAFAQGIRRAVFSHEAGLGYAAMAHASVKSESSVKVGCVSALEPFIDTVIICALSGLVIVITGVFETANISEGGIIIMQNAFSTSVLKKILPFFAVVVSVFALSTTITYTYYVQSCFSYLKVGQKKTVLFYTFMLSIVFLSGIMKFEVVLSLADILILSMSIPNVIGIFLLRNELVSDIKDFFDKK